MATEQEVDVENAIVEKLIKQMNALPSNLQQQVLDYVQALRASTHLGVSGSQLLRFAGAIPSEEIDRLRQAIEEGCEQVEPYEW